MIGRNDVQAYTPSIGEFLGYYTFEHKIKNGYNSWVLPEGIGIQTLSTFYVVGGNKEDDYGFASRLHSETYSPEGHSPVLKMSRNSELFRYLEMPGGLVEGETFSLPGQKYDVPSEPHNGEEVTYRVEWIQDDSVVIRPTKPIAFDALYKNNEHYDVICVSSEICRKLEEDFVKQANKLIDLGKSRLRSFMKGFAVDASSVPATGRLYSLTADELLAICPVGLSVAQQRQMITNANKLMDNKQLTR